MRFAFLAAFLLVSCVSQREICYAEAEAAADRRAETACPDSWDECPKRQEIVDELKKDFKQCRSL